MNLNNYLDRIQENLKNQGALDIKNNVETKNGNFNADLVVKLTNFELDFGLFKMRGDTFFLLTYFPSINIHSLRQYSTECLEYGKYKSTSSIFTQIFNFRIPINICFSIAVVDNLDQENKTKIRQENSLAHNVNLLWYEIPVVYCLSEEQLYFYDRPSSFWEQFKGEIVWKRLRKVIEATFYAKNSPEKESKTPNFFAYDDVWVGRETLINQLTNKVKGSCRLLILVGITGIGKTALGERLAVELEDWFSNWNYYLQENFDNEEQTSDFGSVAARLLEKFGELVTPNDRKDIQQLMDRLVKHLQENRYLIQIDSLENILQGNEEEGWSGFIDEWWVKFMTTWLSVDTCKSCLILTSQDLPAQIPFVGTRSQNFWLCQPLSGLEKLEQLALFNKTGLDISETAEGKPYLERIGRAYEGHPLALRVIAGEIVNHPFNGDILEYWNEYGKEIEEVEKAIEEGKAKVITASADDQFNLDKYTRNLRINVKNRLEKTFNRLKEETREAYLLLCESSVYRREVPEDFWLSHLEYLDIDKDRQEMALDVLRDRCLVEETVDENNQLKVRQHNLIRSVSLEHLRHLGDDE